MTIHDKALDNEDTIFHYTSSKTAIEQILFKGTLKFSSRASQTDPFESRRPSFQHDSSSSFEDKEEMVQKVSNKFDEMYNNLYQISFCKNGYYLASIKPNLAKMSGTGFTKSRMWEIYGDGFKGVCLAFSKEKIKKLLKEEDKEFYNHPFNYLNNEQLNKFSFGTVHNKANDSSQLQMDDIRNKLLEHAFSKPIDYQDENEERFMVKSDKDYFLDFKDSKALVGIITCPHYQNEYLQNEFGRYADEYHVNLTKIVFAYDGVYNLEPLPHTNKFTSDPHPH